ncbi:hypothetical protein M2432_004116 [Mycobacterium sp. OTB74]|nr:hypothetical protein [Mycobacterium sp. OTB74]
MKSCYMTRTALPITETRTSPSKGDYMDTTDAALPLHDTIIKIPLIFGWSAPGLWSLVSVI